MSRGELAVIDTNGVVAGFLTGSRVSPTVQILDQMLSGELRFAVSVELLAEYRAVLLRPKVQQRHGLDAEGIDAILGDMARNAVVGSLRSAEHRAPDPGDQHLWDLLEGLGRGVLVTGDQGVPAARSKFRVMTPGEYLSSRPPLQGWPPGLGPFGASWIRAIEDRVGKKSARRGTAGAEGGKEGKATIGF